jgi:hypothetical protein
MRTERVTLTYTGGQCTAITLDSGARVNVWPEHLLQEMPMELVDEELPYTKGAPPPFPSIHFSRS